MYGVLLSQANNSTLANASADLTNGFASAHQLTGVVVVLVGIVIVVFFASILVESLKAYEWFLRVIEGLSQSLEYAIKGFITSVVLTVIVGPIYLLSQADGQTKSMVAQAIGVVVAGYVALVILGYIGEWVWQGIASQHEQVTGHRPFEGDADEAN